MALLQYREALRQAMEEEMARDPRVFLMGEEVGAYNGAYKVSQGLLEKFGPERVIDTPIAEAGFIGVGIGAAMCGLRPIVEVMTWNFSIVGADQIINHAAKTRYMSGGQFSVPMVLRGPTGAANELACQHSQSLEPMFAYFPGLKVVYPGTPKDAKGLLKSAIRNATDPICFMENETLYGVKGEVPDGEYLIPIGEADVKREGGDVTLVCWGKMVNLCLEAAEALAQEEIEAEVLDLRTIRPLDEKMLFDSVRKTNRCVVVEECFPFGGIGAEIAFRLQKNLFDYLDAPVQRVTHEDVPLPYSKPIEALALPSVAKVVVAAKHACYK